MEPKTSTSLPLALGILFAALLAATLANIVLADTVNYAYDEAGRLASVQYA
jgi:hypothetical protein